MARSTALPRTRRKWVVGGIATALVAGRRKEKSMQRGLAMLFALIAVACGSTRPAGEIADVRIELSPEVLPPHGLLLLGDIYGTREIPRAVGRMVEMVTGREPVVLALEIPRSRTPSLQSFFDSDGSGSARQRLIADPWWQEPFQDGRRSVAMAELLEFVRALRVLGRRIDVVAIDADELDASPQDREDAMARQAVMTLRANSDAAMIVFTGNNHTGRSAMPDRSGITRMAMQVAAAGLTFVTLNARWDDGTAWQCPDALPEHCTVRLVVGDGAQSGIHLQPSKDRAFDGWFGVGALTASPPAGIPELAVGIDAKIAEVMTSIPALRTRAFHAYGAKNYLRCASLFAKIFSPESNDAYNHACCLALAGRKTEAFARLHVAIANGFHDRLQAEFDPDLASLRSDKRWPWRR
jgi:hypothetical protein